MTQSISEQRCAEQREWMNNHKKARNPMEDPQPGDTVTHYELSEHDVPRKRYEPKGIASWSITALKRDKCVVLIRFIRNLRQKHGEVIYMWKHVEDWEKMCKAEPGNNIYGSWHVHTDNAPARHVKWRRVTKYGSDALLEEIPFILAYIEREKSAGVEKK